MKKEDELTVEIPKFYLLTIAAHGNMGDGELPKLMQTWAQIKCRELGLDPELISLQKERLRVMETNLRNVLGDDAMNSLAKSIKKAADIIKNACRF
jgi:hypothetical protein